jgi:hypothetical protein
MSACGTKRTRSRLNAMYAFDPHQTSNRACAGRTRLVGQLLAPRTQMSSDRVSLRIASHPYIPT